MNLPKDSIVFASSKIKHGNMSLLRGDLKQNAKNRVEFIKSLNINPKQVLIIAADNKCKIKVIDKISQSLRTDGVVTNNLDLFLMFASGDCLPIGIYDPIKYVIALIHGSRKGLDEEIIKQTFQTMKIKFNSNPQDLIVKIGPSIGPCCYTDFVEFEQKKNLKWKNFINKRNGKYSINLWGFTEQNLVNLGVKSENINNIKDCTFHSGKYFSHRQAVLENNIIDPRFCTIMGIK